MKYELWGNNPSEFSYLFEDHDITKRVYLEKHDLIDGLDVSEIGVLTDLYNKELLKGNGEIDIKCFLIELSRDWFSLVSCRGIYVNFKDCILFNYQNKKFESMVDDYSSCVESYVDAINDEGKFVTLVENDFDYIKKFEINESSQIVVKRNIYFEEFIYSVKDSEDFIVARDDMALGVSKGLILRECELNDYYKNIVDEIIGEVKL